MTMLDVEEALGALVNCTPNEVHLLHVQQQQDRMPGIFERATHLPGELLAHVFDFVSLDSENGKARACVPFQLSCVSRRFRDVTLGIRGM